jgi:uncharacterized membrane protein YqjE
MSAGLLESARNLLAGLIELGHTRFELFSTELREELTQLAVVILGGLAVLMLVGLALAFGAAAVILAIGEAHRLAATIAVAVFFLAAAALLAWYLRPASRGKSRPFDATLTELQRDLDALRS